MARYVIRLLSRRVSLSLPIVFTLALAIGANTAIYSVAKAVILTPLPFPGRLRLTHLGRLAASRHCDARPLNLCFATVRAVSGPLTIFKCELDLESIYW
jgi:hypothetical protein